MNTPTTPAWKLHRHEEVGSTNDLAGALGPWNAVTAKRQTKGRGRYRRSWVSDEGGIWISATLPTPGDPARWGVLPLAAGWALRASMESLGVSGMRLRWPNDLLTGPAKLAGILVERFRPDAAVVGIGINYTNTPEACAPELRGLVTRLADLLDPLPSQETVIASLLAHLALAQERIEAGQVEAFLPDLNRAWQIDRVVLNLNEPKMSLTGSFLGVDSAGNLIVRADDGTRHSYSPLNVELLREL